MNDRTIRNHEAHDGPIEYIAFDGAVESLELYVLFFLSLPFLLFHKCA